MQQELKHGDDDGTVTEFARTQLRHFQEANPECRGMQLPEGILVRYLPFKALYFYLRSGVKDGKIVTRVFATDSPYERQKTAIGEVTTTMFEARSDLNHFKKLEKLLRSWIDFVTETPDTDAGFQSFTVEEPKQ
jgi:hypothetical protein